MKMSDASNQEHSSVSFKDQASMKDLNRVVFFLRDYLFSANDMCYHILFCSRFL